MTDQEYDKLREDIIKYDLNGLYDDGERDFFDDCRELLELSDTPKIREIFSKSCEYAFGETRYYWLEAFEDWVQVLEEEDV